LQHAHACGDELARAWDGEAEAEEEEEEEEGSFNANAGDGGGGKGRREGGRKREEEESSCRRLDVIMEGRGFGSWVHHMVGALTHTVSAGLTLLPRFPYDYFLHDGIYICIYNPEP
jgi:hypothetical protein